MNENENEKLPLSDEPSEAVHETTEPPVESSDEIAVISDAQDDKEIISEAEPMPPEPTVFYRWDYEEQLARDAHSTTKHRRSGVLTFAIVMSACFLLTLLVLIGALISDGLPKTQTGGQLNVSEGSNDTLTLQQISARGNEVVVAISVKTPTGSGSGTGIVMTSDGYIATNHHVIENATEIIVQLYDGQKYSAKLIGSSEIDDLAVIKIGVRGLTPATFGDSSAVSVGDRAVVIGHPAGLEFGWTSTYGFVSAINRDVKIRDYDGTLIKKMTLLQTDANVNSGNSGGPMFNDRGEVIGIITLKLAGDYEGMGFAIPSNGAVPLLDALMKTGTTDGVQSAVSSQRPELGITGVSVEKDHYYLMGETRIYELTEDEAATTEGAFKAEATGVYISAVAGGSGAFGKLMVGDIVTAVDGTPILATTEIREILYDKRVGDSVEMTLVRDGEQITASVELKAAAN